MKPMISTVYDGFHVGVAFMNREKNMTKFNLTDETIKVGDLKLDKSQFDIPKKVTILSSRVATSS